MRQQLALFIYLGCVSCANTLTASPQELEMASHPLAGAGGALVLERKGIMILSYSEETNDYTGAGQDFQNAMSSAGSGMVGPLPSASTATVMGQTLVNAGVQSYSLEVLERIKLLDAGAIADRNITIPAGCELEEAEARLIRADGTEQELPPPTVKDGILDLDLPSDAPGAVVAYRYKVRTRDLDSFHSWRFQGPLPILASSFRLRFKQGTEIPVHLECDDSELCPRYHLKVAKSASSRTQVKAWAVWELTDVPATPEGANPVALVVGM